MSKQSQVCVLSSVAFAAAVALSGAARGDMAFSAGDYAQDGLIAHWDGIENVGYGQPHDSESTVWKDLKGSKDLTLKDCGSWEASYLKCQGQNGKFAAQGTGKIENVKTIEIVYRETGKNNDLQVILDLGFNGHLVVHNYRNGYVQFSTASGPAVALTSDIYHDYDIVAAATFASTNGSTAASAAYLNGVASSGTYSEGWSTCSTLSIGKCSNNSRVFTGRVYSIRLYDRELSADEIAMNAAIDQKRFCGKSVETTHVWTGFAGTDRWEDAANWQTPDGLPTATPPKTGSVVEIANNSAGSVRQIKLPKNVPQLLGLTVGGAGEVRFSRASPHNDWTSHRLSAVKLELGASTVVTLDEGVALKGWHVDRGDVQVENGAYTGEGEIGGTVDWLNGKGALAVGEGIRLQDYGDTTKLYVQRGLIAQWDGRENAGRGVRDPLASAWKDLAGVKDLTLLDCGSWEGDWLKCVGASGKFAAQGTDKISNAKTIEIVYRETGRNNNLQVVLDLGCGGRFVVHNYRDGYVQFSTASGPAPALTSDQYHDYDILAAATFGSTDSSAAASKVYLNGTFREGTYVEGWNTSGKVSIGKCSNDGRVFTGRVYAIRLYDRELSPKEIARNAAYDRYRFFGGERPVIPGMVIIFK